MPVIFTHCSCLAIFCVRLCPLLADVVKPCDAQRALIIDHVAVALDVLVFERVAAQVAQLVKPAALALNELVFVRIATQGAHYTPV